MKWGRILSPTGLGLEWKSEIRVENPNRRELTNKNIFVVTPIAGD